MNATADASKDCFYMFMYASNMMRGRQETWLALSTPI
jgi:hypothetical protein